jgi:membrane-bound lytic murein transglycosylase D
MVGTAGEDRFFALAEHDALRSETKNYVPQIIAAALVGKEPSRYGFAFDTLAEYRYDSVEVAAGTPLTTVAKVSGATLGTVRELNPAVLRGIVPPTGAMWIRIPANGPAAVSRFSNAIASLDQDERIGFHSLRSKGTETWQSLAAKAGVSANQLAWYNPSLRTTKKGKVMAEQTVLLPTPDAVAGAQNVPDPGIERYGSGTIAATKSGAVHIVKRGESLERIAARYHLTLARIKTLNSLHGNKVVAGQALRVKAAPTPVHVASMKVRSAPPARSAVKSRAKGANKVTKKPGVVKQKSSKGAKKAAAPKGSPKHTAASKVASRND